MESGTATPTIQIKNGKIVSVNVDPFNAAGSSGASTSDHVPGLLTSIIEAMVTPRNTSSDMRRPAAGGAPEGEIVPVISKVPLYRHRQFHSESIGVMQLLMARAVFMDQPRELDVV